MDQAGEWIFNAPWWLLIAVGVAAVAFLLWSLSRGDKQLARAAVGAVLLAVLWAALSLAVTTPIELARARTLGLVRAYEAKDWARFASLIDPETRFHTLLKGQEITDAARLTHDSLRTGTIRVTSVDEKRDGLGVIIDVRILSEQDTAYARSAITAWRFDYRKRGDAWKLEHIDPLPTEQVDLPNILRHVQLPPGLGRAD